MKLSTILCLLGGLLSANVHSTEKNEPFFFKTYHYAKSSEILNTAAKCELASIKLNLSNSNQFYIKAVMTLSMDFNYASHSLLEYELAYDVVKNYHYGRFSVIDLYNKDNVDAGYKYIYQNLKCIEILK